MKTNFLTVLDDPPAVVDCGTCPATMACAVGKGGTGWTYPCCGSTSVDEGDVMLILDCRRHAFEIRSELVASTMRCFLCTGGFVTRAYRDAALERFRYVPTRHAKIPLDERLASWREALAKYQTAKKGLG